LGAHWAEVIALPGYSLQESDGSLELTLYWQALQRMETSYKVFVHLIDTASSSLVAQNDSIPRGWSYPTNWWEKGEVVEDSITLQVDDIPPGKYRLEIGLYDAESGERLPAFSAGGEPYPANAVQLTIWQQ
jgi:hypothetical protein